MIPEVVGFEVLGTIPAINQCQLRDRRAGPPMMHGEGADAHVCDA